MTFGFALVFGPVVRRLGSTTGGPTGRAIDFERCWYASDCFQWLSNNAAAYGFRNLPGESWHWSTNGR